MRFSRTCNNPTPSCRELPCRGISVHEELCNEFCCRGKIIIIIILHNYQGMHIEAFENRKLV